MVLISHIVLGLFVCCFLQAALQPLNQIFFPSSSSSQHAGHVTITDSTVSMLDLR